MIIANTIIRPNGDIEVVDIEVADNYFDAPRPPQPTETEKLRADVDFLAMETGVTL